MRGESCWLLGSLEEGHEEGTHTQQRFTLTIGSSQCLRSVEMLTAYA